MPAAPAQALPDAASPAAAAAATAPRPTAPSSPRPPSRLRFAGLVLLFVYPLVTALQLALLPLTATWPLLARNALLVPLMVGCMVWGVIPLIQTRLRHLL